MHFQLRYTTISMNYTFFRNLRFIHSSFRGRGYGVLWSNLFWFFNKLNHLYKGFIKTSFLDFVSKNSDDACEKLSLSKYHRILNLLSASFRAQEKSEISKKNQENPAASPLSFNNVFSDSDANSSPTSPNNAKVYSPSSDRYSDVTSPAPSLVHSTRVSCDYEIQTNDGSFQANAVRSSSHSLRFSDVGFSAYSPTNSLRFSIPPKQLADASSTRLIQRVPLSSKYSKTGYAASSLENSTQASPRSTCRFSSSSQVNSAKSSLRLIRQSSSPSPANSAQSSPRSISQYSSHLPNAEQSSPTTNSSDIGL